MALSQGRRNGDEYLQSRDQTCEYFYYRRRFSAVAGIKTMPTKRKSTTHAKGQPQGRKSDSMNAAPPPPPVLNQTAAASEGKPTPESEKESKNGPEFWKIIVGAVLALLLSTAFISAAIPRYKLLIKSPAFKKENVYEVPEGDVTIRWMLSKEQWFREVDVSDVKANVTIRKYGEEKGTPFPNSPGEVTVNLKPGKYEVSIDAVEQQRSEIIALEISVPPEGSKPETAELTGTVVDQNDKLLQGANVTIDEVPGMKPVETSSDGVFIISEIPRKYNDRVRVRVVKEGYQPNPYTEDVFIGASPPRIKLRRER
jgi:hypothetical protein